MKYSLCAALFVTFASGCTSQARTTYSPEVAKQKCDVRIARFAAKPRGRDFDYPDPQLVKREYRSCFYGYARQYPDHVPTFRPTTLFSLDKVLKK